MKNKLKDNLGVILIILSIIVVWTTIGYLIISGYTENKHGNKTNGKALYYITYYDDYIPGSKYDISIFDNRIEFIKTNFCSMTDCEPTINEKETLSYSKKNADKLKEFIKYNLKADSIKPIELHRDNLDEYQKDVISTLLLGEYFFELDIENYKYRLEYYYSDNEIYDIYLKDNNSVLVKKARINNDYDITNINTYNISFSKKNMELIRNYIIKYVEENNDDKNFAYIYSVLVKDEIPIMESIINNDESLLSDIKKLPKLKYIMSFDGLDCHTPVIYFYDDNSFEYYYTFTTGHAKPKPKNGVYDYVIENIIVNEKQDDDFTFGLYTIKDVINNKSYTIDVENKEINELLGSINVSLKTCLVQQ